MYTYINTHTRYFSKSYITCALNTGNKYLLSAFKANPTPFLSLRVGDGHETQWNSEDNGRIPVAQTALKPALYTEYQLLGHLGLLDIVLTIVFMIFKVQQGRNKKVTSNYKND